MKSYSNFLVFQYLQKKSVKIPESEAPKNVTCDWIGPMDKQSNLRPVHFYMPPDETQAEKNLRLKRKALQDFNQHFWSRQNIMFYKVGIIYKDFGSNY